MEHDDRRIAYVAVYGVTLTLIKTFGIIGDIFTFVVLCRRRMKSLLTPVVQSMILSDLLFLLVTYPTHLYFAARGRHLNEPDAFMETYITYVHFCATGVLICASSWLVTVIAVYRFIATKYPLHVNKYCSICRSRIIIIVILVLSFVVNVSRVYIAPSSHTHIFTAHSVHDELLLWRVIDIVGVLVAVLIPWLVCLIFMLMTHRAVRASRRNTLQTGAISGGAVENQLAGTFKTLLTVYLLLVFPHAVSHILRSVVGLEVWYNGSVVYIILEVLGDLTAYSYFSINVLLYTVTSAVFRAEAKACLKCWEKNQMGSRNASLTLRIPSVSSDVRTEDTAADT